MRNMTMKVACAGHKPLVLFRAATGQCERISPAGGMLSAKPAAGVAFEERSLQLEKGDRAVFYSGGLVKIRNEKGEEFGDERLLGFIQANAQKRSRDFCRVLLKEIEKHRGKAEQSHDIALVTFKLEEAGKPTQPPSGTEPSGAKKDASAPPAKPKAEEF